MIAKEVIFEGRVQGVGFRYTVKDIARGFDVCGFVRNEINGTVLLHVMGEPEEIDDFIREILEESPVSHHIKSHTTRPIPPLENPKGFRIEK